MAPLLRAVLPMAMIALVLLGSSGSTQATKPSASPPPLPDNEGGLLLSFATPTLAPGDCGEVTATLNNSLGSTLTNISLELQVYQFAYEGSAQNLSPQDAWAGHFGTCGSVSAPPGNGFSLNVTLPTLSATAAPESVSEPFSVPSSASTGAFFIRDRLNFSAAGSNYELASRGFFSDSLWSQATLNCSANGTCTPDLDLKLLGVSGISPETSVAVQNPWADWVLGGILATAVVLAGAAGYVAFRRSPAGKGPTDGDRSSRSGTSSLAGRRRAAKALGKRRTKDGD